jgi:hypothetical protein
VRKNDESREHDARGNDGIAHHVQKRAADVEVMRMAGAAQEPGAAAADDHAYAATIITISPPTACGSSRALHCLPRDGAACEEQQHGIAQRGEH